MRLPKRRMAARGAKKPMAMAVTKSTGRFS
jgi:hypothetical protein